MKKAFSLFLIFALLALSCPMAAYAEDNAINVSLNGETVYSVSIDDSDITLELRDAFSYCDNNPASKAYTLKVPAGNYTVCNTVTLCSHIILDLAGVTLTTSGADSNIFMTPTGVGGYAGLTDVTVSGGTMIYPAGYAGDSCLLRLAHANNLTFKNVRFLNNYRSHHIELAACKNVVFDGCVFDGQTASLSETSGEALQIDILEEGRHFSLAPPYDGTMNDGITVKNCTFKNLLRGVGTHSSFAGMYQKNISITNCTFENITSTAITCFNYINSTVSGNTIKNCGEGIHYYMMLSDTQLSKMCLANQTGSINTNCASTIQNNTINVKRTDDAPQSSAIYIFGNNITAAKTKAFPAGDYYVGNITVKGNTVETEDYGIRLHDVKNSKITSNKAYNEHYLYNAIYLADGCDNNTVSGNSLSCFESNVNLKNGCKNNKITSNKIYFANNSGVLLQSGCDNNTVGSNEIYGCSNHGILVLGATGITCNSNTVSACKGNGLCLMDEGTLKSFNSNKISQSGKNGVYAENKTKINTFKNNTLIKNKNNGISTYGTIKNISSNTFEKNAGWAIFFGKGATATLSKNTYTKNAKGSNYTQGKKNAKFGNLSKPSVKLTTKSKAVTLKWKKVTDATKYEVYRATSKKGTYKKIATVSKTTYKNTKLKKGKKYFYKVKAIRKINSITVESPQSDTKSIKVK